MRVVLASESQSRKRAMDLLGIAYETRPSGIDEKSIRDPGPGALTKKLAEAKAWKLADACAGAVIVAGDAVVVKDGTIFEKPRNIEEAVEFLGELSGSAFQFVTSLVVLRPDIGKNALHYGKFGDPVSTPDCSRNPRLRQPASCSAIRRSFRWRRRFALWRIDRRELQHLHRDAGEQAGCVFERTGRRRID